ncbi:MAG: cation transporter [Promethearchaeota archaeon]
MGNLFDNIRLKASKFSYHYEKKVILELLSQKSHDFDSIRDFFLLNKQRHFRKVDLRVEKALLYLKEDELVTNKDDMYYLTEKGKSKVDISHKRTQQYRSWTRGLTNQRFSFFILLTGSLVLWLVKIIGYIHTGNLIFLSDSFSSIFGVLTIAVVSIAIRIEHETILIRIIQVFYILTGISFFIAGILLTLNPGGGINLELSFFYVAIAILIGLSLFLYLHFASSVNNSLNLLVFTKKVKGDIFLPALALFPIVAELFGLFFIEGLIALTYGIIIMGEAIRINLERYTRHVLMFLNERPYSYHEILDIDSRIAMFFGAPMFLEEARNPIHTWWNQIGLTYLEKKEIIKKEEGLYSLTEKGKQPADDAVKQMIKFLRFVFSLTKPAISPILSLILHLFLGSLKLIGFVITGSISLLGDGLDSAIDGISSIVVGLSMKIKKEIQATYILIGLMVFTGIGVVFSSIDRILHPVGLAEEMLAITIAVISIIFCICLYLYQRYSGYINQSLAILAQSEDSKNHVLNALLVLIAIGADYFQIYILDGLVGCFIGFIILKGAYEIFQDLRSVSQGEAIDYEKYKLGVWKSYSRFQDRMLGNWVLYQILNGTNQLNILESAFDNKFSPITLNHSQGDSFTINYSHDKEGLHDQINSLLENKLIQKQDSSLVLTNAGKKQILKVIARHRGRF